MDHEHNRLAERVSSRAHLPHHADSMAHVQASQRLVEQHVIGVLRQNHGHERTLTLAARKLVDEPILEPRQIEKCDGGMNRAPIRLREPSRRVRKSAERDELLHGESRHEVILLAQNRDDLRELPRLREAYVEATDLYPAAIGFEQSANDRKHGRLARPVRPDEGGHATGLDGEVDRAEHVTAGIVFLNASQLDSTRGARTSLAHRSPFLNSTIKNSVPPTNSMITVTSPAAEKRCRSTNVAASRVTRPMPIASGSTSAWRSPGAN